MRSIVRTATIVTFLGLATVLGCGGDSPDPGGGNRATEVDSITYPSSGCAQLHGSFFSTETVLIKETDGTLISQGTPDSDRNAFTLSTIPTGTHSYEIFVSCDSGPESLGNFTFNEP
ncbi:MAG: hypothetical protein ABIQ10_07570 [Gemmatimonadaceae bacterium]